MLASALDLLWIFGAACSAAVLLYGCYLVYIFQTNASVANQRAVARLALHESPDRDEVLFEIKEIRADFLNRYAAQLTGPGAAGSPLPDREARL